MSLQERFVANPALTHFLVRKRFGLLDELAAGVYALIFFLCDGLLQLKPPAGAGAGATATRFFGIASKLPMELQMVLCLRAVGSI